MVVITITKRRPRNLSATLAIATIFLVAIVWSSSSIRQPSFSSLKQVVEEEFDDVRFLQQQQGSQQLNNFFADDDVTINANANAGNDTDGHDHEDYDGDHEGHDHEDHEGDDHEGHDHEDHDGDHEGHDHEDHDGDHEGHDHEDHDGGHEGHDHDGDHEGHDHDGDHEGHDHGDHEGHDHGGAGFEWSGVFPLSDAAATDSFTWSMQAVNGEYADPSMRLVLFAVDAASEEVLEEKEEMANRMISSDDESCIEVEEGESISFGDNDSGGECYELHVGTEKDSFFLIFLKDVSNLAVFAQHFPTEFERDQHYLKDSNGVDIEPAFVMGGDDHHGHDHGDHDGHDHGMISRLAPVDSENKNWGAAIAAAFIVNFTTLIGVCALIPALFLGKKATQLSANTKQIVVEIIIPSFACGALIATALFLMIPESLLYLALQDGDDPHEGHDHGRRYLEGGDEEGGGEEAGAAWKFGASVLGGYFIPFLASFIFPHHHVGDDEGSNAAAVAYETVDKTLGITEEKISEEVKNTNDMEKGSSDDNDDVGEEQEKAANSDDDDDKADGIVVEKSGIIVVEKSITPKHSVVDWNLASAILLGDFMHNFVDGIFIGVGFALCSPSFGWTIAFSTIWHELSQEIADFFLLTNQCNLSIPMALVWNYISGLSVVLGVLLILGTNLSQGPVIGSFLAIGSGVYFYLALTEIAARMKKFLTTRERGFLSLLFWICGAVPIGLVLLNHGHC